MIAAIFFIWCKQTKNGPSLSVALVVWRRGRGRGGGPQTGATLSRARSRRSRPMHAARRRLPLFSPLSLLSLHTPQTKLSLPFPRVSQLLFPSKATTQPPCRPCSSPGEAWWRPRLPRARLWSLPAARSFPALVRRHARIGAPHRRITPLVRRGPRMRDERRGALRARSLALSDEALSLLFLSPLSSPSSSLVVGGCRIVAALLARDGRSARPRRGGRPDGPCPPGRAGAGGSLSSREEGEEERRGGGREGGREGAAPPRCRREAAELLFLSLVAVVARPRAWLPLTPLVCARGRCCS